MGSLKHAKQVKSIESEPIDYKTLSAMEYYLLQNLCYQVKTYCVILLFYTAVCSSSLNAAENLIIDSEFEPFFKRFVEDSPFQQSRIVYPLVIRFGDYLSPNYLVRIVKKEQIKATFTPLIFSERERSEEQVSNTITKLIGDLVELRQEGPPEGDLYKTIYTFKKISGCWFLIEIHDKSR